MDDVQLKDQLARELAETSPPLGTVVADALAVGTRTRRRRRFAVAGSGAAVVLVAAGLLFAGNLGRAPAAPQPVGAPAAARKATTGQAVIVLLTDLVSSGGQITEVEGTTADDVMSGSFLYDDGHGPATVSGSVATKPMDMGPDVADMRCPANEPDFTCVNSVTPEGYQVRLLTMGPYHGSCTESKCGIKDVRVEVKRAAGVYVVVESYNGPFGRGRAATRADTLLSADQMIAMARDPRWGLTMDASFVDDAQTRVDPKDVVTVNDVNNVVPHK
jgi:hypothetical protein